MMLKFGLRELTKEFLNVNEPKYFVRVAQGIARPASIALHFDF